MRTFGGRVILAGIGCIACASLGAREIGDTMTQLQLDLETSARLDRALHRNETLWVNMDTTIRIAAANHFGLQSINAKGEVLRETLAEKNRAYLPSMGLSLERTRNILPGSADNILYDVKLTVEQVMFDGGRRDLDMSVVKIERMLNRQEFRINFNQLRLEIQKAYLRVLAAAGRVLLNEKSLERARLQLKQAHREEKLGFSTKLQVMDVAAKVQELELSLLKARHEHIQSLHDMKLAMRLEKNVDLRLEGDIFKDFYLQVPVLDLETLAINAQANRSEVLQSKGNIQKVATEKKIAGDSWLPKITLDASLGRSGDRLESIREKSWSVGFRMQVPIGSHTSVSNATTGQTRAEKGQTASSSTGIQFWNDLGYDRRVLESEIALGQALSQDKDLHRKISIDVEKAYDTLKEAWEAIRLGNGRVYFRDQSLRIMETRFRVGQIRRADLVAAQTEMLKAEEEMTGAIAGYITAAYELEWTSGLDPGALELFFYKPGAGNTLLAEMVERSDAVRSEKPKTKFKPLIGEIDIESVLEDQDEEAGDFLLEGVEVDD